MSPWQQFPRTFANLWLCKSRWWTEDDSPCVSNKQFVPARSNAISYGIGRVFGGCHELAHNCISLRGESSRVESSRVPFPALGNCSLGAAPPIPFHTIPYHPIPYHTIPSQPRALNQIERFAPLRQMSVNLEELLECWSVGPAIICHSCPHSWHNHKVQEQQLGMNLAIVRTFAWTELHCAAP